MLFLLPELTSSEIIGKEYCSAFQGVHQFWGQTDFKKLLAVFLELGAMFALLSVFIAVADRYNINYMKLVFKSNIYNLTTVP